MKKKSIISFVISFATIGTLAKANFESDVKTLLKSKNLEKKEDDSLTLEAKENEPNDIQNAVDNLVDNGFAKDEDGRIKIDNSLLRSIKNDPNYSQDVRDADCCGTICTNINVRK